LLKYKDNKVVKIGKLDYHRKDIEVTSFAPNGELFATGGADGRVFLFDGLNMFDSFAPRADYISAIVFSDDGDLIAFSSFDKTTTVYSIKQGRHIASLETIDVVEGLRFFESNSKLYLICRNGDGIVYDLGMRIITSIRHLFMDWPSALNISRDSRFALVGTRTNRFYIVNLAKNMVVEELFFEKSGVTNILFYEENKLIITFVDGTIFVINLNENVVEFENFLKDKKYKDAKFLISKNNIFLKIHSLSRKFDEDWAEVLKEAVSLISGNNIAEASELVAPFLDDLAKKEEYNQYLEGREEVAKFIEAYRAKDYPQSYAMSRREKFLQTLKEYHELEELWHKHFALARKSLETNHLDRKTPTDLLEPFKNVDEKKKIISFLLANPDIFADADKLIKNRHFEDYFTLANKAPILQESETYKKVLLLANSLYEKLLTHISNSEYREATQMADYLIKFRPLEKKAKEKGKEIENIQKFLELFKSRSRRDAFKLVESYEYINSLPEYRELLKEFEKTIETAKNFAYNGNSKATLETVKEYLEIDYCKDKVKSIIRISYLNEMRAIVDIESVKWIDTFTKYIDIFGKDEDLIEIATAKNLADLVTKIEVSQSKVSKNSEFYETVLVFAEPKSEES